ncbi:hypothetical protein PHISP_02877 [Aspergillus sp. HF37]|nr:hypothetical protein PHISP_02877 [Aspergillus sp. HF37]
MGSGSTSPKYFRTGGMPIIATGPMLPIRIDQKYAGRSWEAQRKYRRGVDQKLGLDIANAEGPDGGS